MRIGSALFCSMLALAACASSSAYAPPDHGPDRPGPDPARPGELPPQTFEARTHEPRVHPQPVAAPLSSLPALVRSSKCVPAGAVPEGRPRPARVAKAKKPSFVPFNAGATADSSQAAPASAGAGAAPASAGAEASTAPAPQPSAAPATESRSAGADEEASPAGGMAQAAAAPPAPAKKSAARETRRQRRKARRATSKGEALAPAAPPEPEAAPTPPPADDLAIASGEIEPELPPENEGWGEAVYLSNDDTMSLSSAQRVMFDIDEFQPIAPADVRPHELLNYFSFQTAPVDPDNDFSVEAEIAPSSTEEGIYNLALSIGGRPVGRSGRRNAVLTLVVDRSGSMRSEGRMDFLKRGMLRMIRELKSGDVVNVVTFDHRVCVPLQNYVVGRDDPKVLTRTIQGIHPSGRTNIHAGLTRGYELADRDYQPHYTNRVLLVTDALANTGDTDPRTLALVSDWYDSRRIRLSGIGVGREFNDALLDRLTEKGRGAYVFLGSEAEVDAVFGDHFVSLIETTANDVHFRLHLPRTLRMQAFHGEEASTVKEDVQAVHFFADTSVLLLSDLEAWQGQLRPQDGIMVEIDYLDPESGEPRLEEYAFTLGDIGQKLDNVHKAEVVTTFIEGIARMAARGAPATWQPRPGTWEDAEGLADCARTRDQLQHMPVSHHDPEVQRVMSLWDRFCVRFEGPGGPRPLRKDERPASWPGAR